MANTADIAKAAHHAELARVAAAKADTHAELGNQKAADYLRADAAKNAEKAELYLNAWMAR